MTRARHTRTKFPRPIHHAFLKIFIGSKKGAVLTALRPKISPRRTRIAGVNGVPAPFTFTEDTLWQPVL